MALVLPPDMIKPIEDRLIATGLPLIILAARITEEVIKDPAREKRLIRIAKRIGDHLKSGAPGWGAWPTEVEDALFIGMLLGVWLELPLKRWLSKCHRTK